MPNAYFNLGVDYERKGDRASALQQYRVAYEIEPQNQNFKTAYERMLKH